MNIKLSFKQWFGVLIHLTNFNERGVELGKQVAQSICLDDDLSSKEPIVASWGKEHSMDALFFCYKRWKS